MTDNNLASFAGLGGIGSEVWPLTGMEIISRAKLKDLRQRRNAPGFFFLATHVAALAVTGGLVYLARGSWFIIPAWFLYGTVIVLLFAPLHECSHGTAFRTRWINAAIGFAVGALTQRPFLYFKYRHSAHHTYTQHEELDPDIVPFPSSLRAYFALIMGVSFWPKLVGTLYRGCTGNWNEEEKSFLPDSEKARVSLEIRVQCLLYAAIAIASFATGSTVALVYWMIPRILGEPILRAIRMAEHTGTEESPNLLANTRTTLANRVFRTLYWNMPFHAEHHLASSVPFHSLGNLHKEVRPHLVEVSPTYYQVHRDILRQILSKNRVYPASSAAE